MGKFYLGDKLVYPYVGNDYAFVNPFAPDPDATAFLTATGITDSTIQNAINNLVVDLKGYGIWTKMKAIYPFVGGTVTTNKYNLKDPQDTDGAFRIAFGTGFTFSADGVTASGTSASNTYVNISTDLSQNDSSVSIYVGSNTSGEDKIDFGFISSANGIQILTRNVANQFGGKMMDSTNNSYANTDSRGFYQFSRDNSSTYYAQKNTTRNTATQASITPPSGTLRLGGLATVAFATKEYRFASAGQALSTTEMDDYYTAVQAFQTSLSRQV